MTSQKIELKSKSLKSTVCWTAILSWRKEHSYHIVTLNFCIRIETVNLIDGDYELIPADFITPESASVNYNHLNQDPGQAPEEPKADGAQEGKPRCI